MIILKKELKEHRNPNRFIVNVKKGEYLFRFVYRKEKESNNWNFEWYEPVLWLEEDDYYAPYSSHHTFSILLSIHIEKEEDKIKHHYYQILDEAETLLETDEVRQMIHK